MQKTLRTSMAAAAVLGLGAVASAQGDPFIQFNEIYASHTGVDDMEFIEIEGTAGTSLILYLVLVVEGDDPVNGTLDRVWNLTGSIPADQFYVLGDTAVPNVDFDIGTDNSIENGSETFYLIEVDTAQTRSSIQALLGSDVDADGDLVTDIATLAGVTIHDIVGMVDDDATDVIYDGAQVLGPDGSFFPAGIYRGGPALTQGAPWCSNFLDFGLGADRTPGAPNIGCEGDDVGEKYCQANPNSTGAPADISAAGSSSIAANDLTLTSEPVPDQPGIFFYADNQNRVPFGNGFLCATGNIVRSAPQIASGNTISLSYDTLAEGWVSGQTVHFQHWYRDPAAGGANFNTSNAISVTFTP